MAHLFPTDDQRKARSCFPERYLELWDAKARAEMRFRKRMPGDEYVSVEAAECGVPSGFLEPIGKVFDCVIPGRCGGERPFLGVALEGGGSKSAPFALGVLAGLEKTGLLERAEVIASVSGGTYAAHFYFSRLLDALEPGSKEFPRPLDADLPSSAWFADCVPTSYKNRFVDFFGGKKLSEIPLPGALRGCDPDGSGERGWHREAPFQSHVREYQDLVYPAGNWRRSGGDLLDWPSAAANIAWLVLEHVVTMVPHHIAHTLFDWPLNFSPSREAYRAGIERAYGHTPASWAAAQEAGPNDSGESMRVRKNHSLRTLGEVYQGLREQADVSCRPPRRCRLPLWVAGTTSSTGRSLDGWLVAPARDSLRSEFELTPFSYGSGTVGYLNSSLSAPPLRDITGASAAFLDDEERQLAGQPTRLLANAALHLINADWSTELDNFNATDSRRLLHDLMPWPLYLMPVFGGREAPYIHLSDGGNTDNLALLALLRRGVRNIVISASTDDRLGQFPSLCQAKNQLELDGSYSLVLPELQGFELVCNQQLMGQEAKAWGDKPVRRLYCSRLGLDEVGEDCRLLFGDRNDMRVPVGAPEEMVLGKSRARERYCQARGFEPGSVECVSAYADQPDQHAALGYSLWDWPLPVLQGCVIRGEAPAGDRPCEDARVAGRVLSNLFVVKPAIDLRRFASQMAWAGQDERIRPCGCNIAGKETDALSLKIGHCPSQSVNRFVRDGVAEGEQPMDIPCQALAFLANNRCKQDSYPDFPQHNFVFMTLNSSHTLYAAYYDLARRYAAQIDVRSSGAGEERLVRKFDSCSGGEACRVPMRTYRYSDRQAGVGVLNDGREVCLAE